MSVQEMSSIFAGAYSFNKPIGGWNGTFFAGAEGVGAGRARIACLV